ncbi:MAG: hypothetical protein ACRDD1_05885 [Planctomycetia bacterium]
MADLDDELLPEYDLSQLKGRVVGKYLAAYRSRPRLVQLKPEVAAVFPTEEAVNQALLQLIEQRRSAERQPVDVASTE